MTHAPPYVSVPWSAATALLPMMMNEFNEHQGAIHGLESTAKLVLRYQLAEDVFLSRDEVSRDKYASVVIDFYKTILKYQARAIQYFGKSTLERLGRNVMGSTLWADMPKTINEMDDSVRGSLNFISMGDQAVGFSSLTELLKRQEERLDALIADAISKTDEVTNIVDWVSGIPVGTDHIDVRNKLGEGHFTSGQWFLANSKVADWKNWEQGCRSLWLRGGIGTGKSSLTSILIEELVRNPDGIIAFFYCSRKVDKEGQESMKRNKVTNVLRSFMGQSAVSTDGGSIYDGLKSLYKRKRSVPSPVAIEDKDCIPTLVEMVSRQPNTRFTLVVDALDECVDRSKDQCEDEGGDYYSLLKELHSLSTARNVRFFFSSRLEVKVKSVFEDAIEVTITSQNSGDIERFLDYEIPRRRDGCGITDSQVDKLREILLSRANGMFLWVTIQLNRFLHKLKSKRIRLESDIADKLEALESFRATREEQLSAAYKAEYERAIGDGSEPNRHRAVVSALQWVLSAFRPLTLRELAYAISVNHSDGSPTRGIQEGLLLEFCSNLLIEDSSSIMQLAHLSVREYLEASLPADFGPKRAHGGVALTSLYFMRSSSWDRFGYEGAGSTQEGEVTLTRGLYDYVTTYWSNHCREAPDNHEVREMLGTVDARPSNSSPDSDQAETTRNENDIAGSNIMSELVNNLTSFAGLDELAADGFIAKHIARNTGLSGADQFGDTVLHYTAKFHRRRGMELLLRAGAPINARNSAGNTPLHVAAMHGFDKGTQQLLLAGADINSRNNRGETALHLALMHGSSTVFETLMLSAGVDALAQDHQRSSPFHYAAQWENLDAVKSLLYDGYSPDSINEAGDTALSIAIRAGNKDMVKELIRQNNIVRAEDVAAATARGLGDLLTASSAELETRPATARLSAASFTAQISEGLPTCQYCNFARWLSSRRRVPHSHWPCFDDLRASAAMCRLCDFFEKEFVRYHSDTIDSSVGRLLVTVELAFDRPWEKSGKDTLSVSLGDAATLTWEICFDNRSSIEPQPTRQGAFALVKDWISDCTSTHEACRDSTAPVTPTRLVDIGEGVAFGNVRMVETKGKDTIAYVYLSYVWGRASEPLCLTTNNFEEIHHKIPFARLPATVADAISIVRSCGLRYIWVDALCIIHDSSEDWRCEFPRIPGYYQSAAFVMAATSSQDFGQGLLRERPAPLHHLGTVRFTPRFSPSINSPVTPVDRVVHLRKPLQLATEAFQETMMKRCFLIPEVILARKLLIWGKDQLYWTCRTCLRSEGSTLLGDPTWVKYLPPPDGAPASPNGIARNYLTWYSLVEVYSGAVSFIPRDRLRAMEPLAQHFNRKSLHSIYVAGLWTDDIANGLLWYAETQKPFDHGVAPSWSWASTMSPVTFCLLRGIRPDLITDANHRVSYVESSLGDYPDNWEYVTLDAMVIDEFTNIPDVARERHQLNCEYFFDCARYEQSFRGGGEAERGRYLFMFVGPWGAGRPGSLAVAQTRCIGLILFDPGLDGASPAIFRRVGLFLGLQYDGSLDDWRRQTVTIA